MEWRFRISGAYHWGTNSGGAKPVMVLPGNSRTASTSVETDTAEQAEEVDKIVNPRVELPGLFQTHAGGHGVNDSSDAGLKTPTLAPREHGLLPGGEGDLQRTEALSLRITLLLGEAELKDARIKELESDLRAKSSERLQHQQQGSPLPEAAEDSSLADLEIDLQSDRDEHTEWKQQITSLLDDAATKDARLKELESELDTKRGEYSEVKKQVTLLLDDAATKDARLKELESELDTKRGEYSEVKKQVTLLLDDAATKDARLKELESELDTKRGEYLEAKEQVTSLLGEAGAKGVRIGQLESSLASERSERLIVQQLYASLRQTIRVMVRIRPPLADANGGHGAASWSTESGSGMLEVEASARSKALKVRFDRVFRPQASNNDIFDEILPLVRQAATEGGRCVVVAYGASSTGKSYTMRGDDKGATPTPGIIQLAGRRLFGMISAGATVEVSSMYAYNGQVWDLLAAKKDRNLDIPATQKACAPATTYKQVRSADELVELFDLTMSKTVKSATLLNAESSRGHYFFIIRVSGQPGDAGIGVLTFVDLAGNESVKESGVEGEQFNESRSINADLFAFGEMMRNLRRGQTADTKRSKLTQLLAGAMGFGTNATVRSEVLMLTTVNLAVEHIQKSVRTLQFAETVVGTPKKPKT